MFKRKKNNKGFTLVELLVVIAIIGILAVVAVPSLFKNIEKAKVSDTTSYISAYKTSAMSVYADDLKKTGSIAVPADDIEGGQPTTITNISASVDNTNKKLVVTVALGEELSTDGKIKVQNNFNDDNTIIFNPKTEVDAGEK